MSDIADEASSIETLWSDLAIRQAHVEANAPAKKFSSCQYCGDPTEDGAKYCSYGPVSCADDDNRRNELLKRQGL